MKKRSFYFIILSFILFFPIYAADQTTISLIPYDAARMVNLQNESAFPVYKGDMKYEYGKLSETLYYEANMIAVIGIIDIPYEQLLGDGASLTINFNCYQNPNNGAYVFRSESNNMYQRPFEISALVQKNYHYQQDNGDYWWNNESVQTIHFSGTNTTNVISGISPNNSSGSLNHNHSIWLDVVLSLPKAEETNDYQDKQITVDGYKYYLSESEDYSSMVEITIIFKGNEADAITKTYTIPFTGFFDLAMANENNPNEETISLAIRKLPAASNIDLENGYTQDWIDVASINAFWNINQKISGTVLPTVSCTNNAFDIFVSTRQNPFEKGGTFKLVHEGVEEADILDDRNSLGFKVKLREDDTGEELEFDGSSFVEESLSNIQSTGISGKCNYAFYSVPDGYNHNHTFNGTLSIRLDKPASIMKEGAYSSTLYVHVFSLK